jgi:uracil-DNA glycosylase family 4
VPTIANCLDCPYGGKAIGPRGEDASLIVLVGEAPGRTEIGEERPFVGRAGAVLWQALAEAGLVEADLFITNAVACRPDPVHPWVKAIDACRGRLVRDIEARPRAVIVALGRTAVRAVTERRGFRMMDVRGTELQSEWGTVLPTLHPAFVRRRGLDGLEYRMLVEDFKHARRLAFGPGE